MENLEKELKAIEEVARKYRNDETINVKIENKKLYIFGKRSYIPKDRFDAIHDDNDTLLCYGTLFVNGERICEKEYVGRTSHLGLDQWPICKTLKEVMQKIA